MSTQRKSRQSEDVQKHSEEANEATPFTQLTYLLRLVTSLNFDRNLRSSFKRNYNASASDPGFTVLDSVAAILVQKHEVVAACHTSDTLSVMAAEIVTPAIPRTDIDVYIDDDVPSKTFPGQSLRLAALSNPDTSEKLDNNSNPHKIQVQTKGENLWEKVEGTQNGWYCAFM
jgi:hypothetical protein